MRICKECVISFFVALYVTGAIGSACIMKYEIPALNPIGMAYIGVTWPVAMACNTTKLCDITPPVSVAKYMFTFN